MSEVHDVLNASLAVSQRLAAEVEALKKQAGKLQKSASVKVPSFSDAALSKATDVLVDCGFVKSASKDAFIKMAKRNPDKVLEALEKVASQSVKPVTKTAATGSLVSKDSFFTVSKAPKKDPYAGTFSRY